MSSTEAIRLQNVVFGYDPRTPVLQVDELVVHAGKRVFLYGPSGSGKTTLLSVITGVLQPQQGSCVVLGKDLTKCGSRRVINTAARKWVISSRASI